MKKELVMLSPEGANPELYAYDPKPGMPALQVTYTDYCRPYWGITAFAHAEVGTLDENLSFVEKLGRRGYPEEYDTWDYDEEEELIDWEACAAWVEEYAAQVL